MKFLKLLKEMWYRKKLINKSYLLSLRSVTRHNLMRKSYRTVIPEWFDNSHKDSELISPIDTYPINDINIHSLSKLQLKSTSIPYQLHSEDRNSMLHSIESRLPFLDYKLVEFCLSLPDAYKIKDGETKAVLRNSLSEILPEKIRQRQDKMGFVAADEIWIRNNSQQIKEELNLAVQITNGLINAKILDKYERFLNGKEGFDISYFKVISFARWIKIFNVKI